MVLPVAQWHGAGPAVSGRVGRCQTTTAGGDAVTGDKRIIELTRAQTKFIRSIARQVREAHQAGAPGAVIAQVFSESEADLLADNLTMVEMVFAPPELAEEIQQVIRAYNIGAMPHIEERPDSE